MEKVYSWWFHLISNVFFCNCLCYVLVFGVLSEYFKNKWTGLVADSF